MSRVCIVTGGTRGIGAGVARTLAAKGWQVVATGVSREEVEGFLAGLDADLRNSVTARVLDVTNDLDVRNFFADQARVDGLVNCAGILRRGEEYDLEVFRQVVEVNLTGTMRMCVAAHPFLAETGGAIVNTASMLSYFGGPQVPAYSASKGGVAQLTKALAVKWAADGIRVNAVAPGWIETEMTRGLREDKAREAGILSRTPLGRWGQAGEVGALVAWLLSEEASFVSGAIYPVDGGYAAA
ncbi:SDR family oxidoreductase [Stappia sp. F7233]|uniref:SDR family oxidoreductase n=1 Tax=Stappia albiluteola TaxID=2758565 RepID=A0A839AKP6_9HYPH|nr:SDR family oxidoreductase [Stappia albiluteola]MBA5779442.1 SDR family oxidoreductase [Stappia albiluteola]